MRLVAIAAAACSGPAAGWAHGLGCCARLSRRCRGIRFGDPCSAAGEWGAVGDAGRKWHVEPFPGGEGRGGSDPGAHAWAPGARSQNAPAPRARPVPAAAAGAGASPAALPGAGRGRFWQAAAGDFGSCSVELARPPPPPPPRNSCLTALHQSVIAPGTPPEPLVAAGARNLQQRWQARCARRQLPGPGRSRGRSIPAAPGAVTRAVRCRAGLSPAGLPLAQPLRSPAAPCGAWPLAAGQEQQVVAAGGRVAAAGCRVGHARARAPLPRDVAAMRLGQLPLSPMLCCAATPQPAGGPAYCSVFDSVKRIAKKIQGALPIVGLISRLATPEGGFDEQVRPRRGRAAAPRLLLLLLLPRPASPCVSQPMAWRGCRSHRCVHSRQPVPPAAAAGSPDAPCFGDLIRPASPPPPPYPPQSYAEFSRALYQKQEPGFVQALQALEQRHGQASRRRHRRGLRQLPPRPMPSGHVPAAAAGGAAAVLPCLSLRTLAHRQPLPSALCSWRARAGCS